MSAPNSSQSPEFAKKEPKVIVLSMKDGKTFRYDFATNVLTNVRDSSAAAAVAAAKPTGTILTSPPLSATVAASSSASHSGGAGKFQNVVVQSVKRQIAPQPGSNILIRAQSPVGPPKKLLAQSASSSSLSSQPQPQLSPIIDIVQQPSFHKISPEIILKTQSPAMSSNAAVLLNPVVKNTTATVVGVPQTVTKKFIITPQTQSIDAGQHPKIIRISQSPSAAAGHLSQRKIVQSAISRAPMPILPKPEAPKLIQQSSQQVILTQSIVQRPAAVSQQVKQSVITIPVATTAFSKLNSSSQQQTVWQTSSQPPALSPIGSSQVICVQSASSQNKMENVKILMEIEEMPSSDEGEEEGQEHEMKTTQKKQQLAAEDENGGEKVVQFAQKNKSVEEEEDRQQQYLNVKRIIEGDGGLNSYNGNEGRPSKRVDGDNATNASPKNGDNEMRKSETATTTTRASEAAGAISSGKSSDTSLLCDEQIASVSPEESPEGSDILKEVATPTHLHEKVAAIKTVDDVKKNLKLDLIASTTHNLKSSVNNDKKIEMDDDNESITSDDQSNQSLPPDQSSETKLGGQEMQTNSETGGNTLIKKPKRSRKPKNPTIITSLGLPYKPPQPSNRRKKVEKKVELELDFHDPIYKIMWEDGIGGLNNCNKLFGFNEFGLVEVLDDKDAPKSLEEEEETPALEENASFKCLRKINDPKDQYVCDVCSKLGTIRDFFSPECCSEACFAITKRRPSEAFNASNSTKDESDSGFTTPVDAKKIMYEGEMITISRLYQRIYDDHFPESKRSYAGRKKKSVSTLPDVHFSWDSYLTPKSVPAPAGLFKTNIAMLKQANNFKVGMKLEAVDPKNQHMICVCTVEEKLGCRMKIHFDGYPTFYDFWVSIDSPYIFPHGFCQATGRKLIVPPRWGKREFDWSEYLDQTNSVGALRSMFPRSNSSSIRNPLKIGMKLEARRGDNWYAGTIIDEFDKRVLIRFDGRFEKIGCTWYDIHSPNLNFCNAHKELENPEVFLPPTGSFETFDWSAHLKDTDAVQAPEDFLRYKKRERNVFESGMKLEVVDPACKQLIRPATVLCQVDYKVQIIFDGFDISYAFWLDDDSEDMFPVNYCKETEHPIEHPPGWNKTGDSGLCEVAGCRGFGNGVYPDRYFHDNPKECPYTVENWARLIENGNNTRLDYKPVAKRGRGATTSAAAASEVQSCEMNERKNRLTLTAPRKIAKVKQESPMVSSHDDTSNDIPPSIIKVPAKRGRKRKIPLPPVEQVEEEGEAETKQDIDRHRLTKIQIMQPFLENYGPQINYSFNLWTRNSKILNRATITEEDLTNNPLKWNVEEVCTFVVKFCDEETTAKFYAQKIDGEAFLGLCQQDLTDLMNIKVGPAVKIYNRILLLRQEVLTKFAEF